MSSGAVMTFSNNDNNKNFTSTQNTGTLSKSSAAGTAGSALSKTTGGVFRSTAAATAARPSVLSSSSSSAKLASTSHAGRAERRAFAPSSAAGALKSGSTLGSTSSAFKSSSVTGAAKSSTLAGGASHSSFASHGSISTASATKPLSSTLSSGVKSTGSTISSALGAKTAPHASASGSTLSSLASRRTAAESSLFGRTSSLSSAPSHAEGSSIDGTSITTSTVSNDAIAKKLAEAKQAFAASRAAAAPKAPAAAPKVMKVGRIDSEGNKVLIKENQEVTDVQYRRFASFIEQKSGIVLGEGKQYLVNSRLTSLLSKFNVATVDDLINKAMEERPNNQIQDEVIDAMTTNETLWFRDTYPYVALETMILPELAKRGKYPVRIWSAACSSGQEPYSIAMVVQEQLSKMLHVDPKKTQIIGTDLSPEMLAHCRKGYYDVHALSRGLSPERKSKFFVKTAQPNMMAIEPRVKQLVEFRSMNLLGSYALMGHFDVIFIRNVLIYFSNDVKAEILRKLTMCLNPGGYLILGSTETLVGVADKYEMLRCNPGIIYKLKPQRPVFN